MTDRELMQMVLDALEFFESNTNGLYKGEFAEERKALRERLAQPKPDAVLAEREACAKLAEEGTGEPLSVTALKICLRERNRIAKAIRARGVI